MSKKATGKLMCKILKGRPVSICHIQYCVDNNYCFFSGDGYRTKDRKDTMGIFSGEPNFLIKLGWQDVDFNKDEKGNPVTIWTAKI